MTLASNYTQFVQQAIQWHQQQQQLLITWADPASPSPCQQGDIVDNQVPWQPVLQQPLADFSNVEQALELTLHEDIKAFYSLYYGAGLAAEHKRGKLALLMVWTSEDVKRLQENIIGHILMKRRLKQRETVFFATTEDDDILLSVLNSTGEVFLEHVGQEVTEKLADDLATFIQHITPCNYDGL
ncbi:SecY-interacting protein [Rheinheimera baltica]|uniref:SecY-interacting protein n=1 Tax=Rheinheimera baltica TaxID=67576 RepID=UPI00273E3F80|nr:SecY-interacting protein [Rheinheimera baltica]MDP5189448.1 SecY-interacting protein [Rheinheimera baltica]